jgi:polyisoprenoid-binding protein YceI
MSITREAVQAIPTGTWSLDPVHSTVGFEVDYLSGTFRGQFREAEATLVSGEGIPVLTGAARVASIDVKDEDLNAHLQSPDFFDAERHPELTFESSEINLDGSAVTIRGAITIKGVERPIELTGTFAEPITDPYGRERLGLRLETAIDRASFGVDWNTPLPSGEPALASEVKIATELFFIRGA